MYGIEPNESLTSGKTDWQVADDISLEMGARAIGEMAQRTHKFWHPSKWGSLRERSIARAMRCGMSWTTCRSKLLWLMVQMYHQIYEEWYAYLCHVHMKSGHIFLSTLYACSDVSGWTLFLARCVLKGAHWQARKHLGMPWATFERLRSAIWPLPKGFILTRAGPVLYL